MFTVKLKMKNGKLIYLNEKDKLSHKLFLEKIQEGDEIEVFMNPVTDKASYAQISKAHACIRALAKESGHSFDEMKQVVKSYSDIPAESGKGYKSFSECSKEEMSRVIDLCIQMGEDLNLSLE